jgi:copper homeostasis protein
MQPEVTVEICVDSLELAQAAARGGADRIELCGPLDGGGITPSAGLAAAARRTIDLPIAMLVRPRTGPFTVSETEFEVMRQDILYARKIGVDIVVLGILHADTTVDVERTRQLVELAQPMPVTFHRAFDATLHPAAALTDVLETGATRILTSGAEASAVAGAPMVHALRKTAAGRIGFLLCGGLSDATVRPALQLSGVTEVHAALRSSLPQNPQTGGLSIEELDHFSQSVTRLKQAIGNVSAEPLKQ